jgi:DNA ligase-1
VAIVGGLWGSGKRAGWLGSLILGIRDPDTGKFLEIGMMGTGIKEKKTNPEDVTFEELTKMLKPLITEEKGNTVKVKPKIVIEVSYEEIQKSPTYESGFALRFPRFLRLRPEKGLTDVDDLARVKKIYDMQKGRAK